MGPDLENEDLFTENEDAENDRDVTIIELEGEQYEVIDSVMYDGKLYVAILPYSEDDIPDDEEVEFTLLEVADDPNDEENCILRTVDDDELYARIGEEFLKRFDNIAEDE
jgi:hypothetical protein